MDFVVLNVEQPERAANAIPIILGRPSLATANALINCTNRIMKPTFGDLTLETNVLQLTKNL